MADQNKTVEQLQADIARLGQRIAELEWTEAERKRAESQKEAAIEALRESEMLLDTTQHLSKVGGWRWDVEKQTMSWTPETYRIHDLIPGEVALGSPEHMEKSLACYEPEDRTTILLAIQRCATQGEPYDLEVPFTSARGRRLWIRTMARAVRNGERLVHVVGNIMDITDRKQAEEALRDSEERYRHLVEQLPEPIAVHSEGRFVFVNPAMVRLLGAASQVELLGQPILSTIHPDFRETVWQRIQHSLSTGALAPLLEEKLLRVDGSAVEVETIAQPIIYDGRRAMQVMIHDITERKRVEELLRESQATLVRAQQVAHVGSWAWHIQENRLECSDEMYHIFGIAKEDFCGGMADAIARSIHPDDRAAVEGANLAVIQNKEPKPLEYRVIWPDGTVRVVWGEAGELVLDGTGNAKTLTGIVQDITERKKAEAEWNKLREQLAQAQKMESIGRLAGGIAHDFNNMLSVIIGHAELALRHMDPANPLSADIEAICQAAQRSAELTRQLLAFARKQVAAPRVLNLNGTIAGMLTMLRRLIGERIDLAWMPGADLWSVKVDPSQVDQVLVNLCLNARDAVREAGKITIETANVVCDEVYCAGHADSVPGEYVLVAVSDNGCGMDQSILAHLFEPFFTTKEMGQGTGLGLAIAYGVIKQNHGFINVYSEPDKGTTFKIYLPQFIGRPEQVTVPTPIVQRGHETVLMVEDEAAIRRLLRAVLEELGYTVLVAGSPDEAVCLAEAHAGEIHLLITDVVMPEMNGPDLAALIRAANPDTKCLFMSGYTANVIADHGVLDQGVRFLQKPFSVDDLAAKVRDALAHEEEKRA